MPNSTKSMRDRIAVGLTVLFLLAFSFYSLRGLLQPEIVSVRFGAPLSDATATLFFRVYLSRNMALIFLGAIFLAIDARKPLAILMTLIAGLPVFDASILIAEFGSAAPLTLHLASFGPIAITAVLLWLRALMPTAMEERKLSSAS